MVQIPFKDRHAIIASYPGQHCNLHHLTTRHPVRFKAQWANVPDCLLYVRGHVAAYVDGVVQDYTVNRSSRIYDMYTVEKINA
ncbi:MAG: hypothetical protein COY40_04985 [Alphaproteobacteria bacterium CG_4_10_14_0_8_um_filter_53_9]|nr:MAG: hypothetical protein COY40_04985 [Alphaproteobacteria bacterium CG_4_10_14_0_8_um_filter_53_9]